VYSNSSKDIFYVLSNNDGFNTSNPYNDDEVEYMKVQWKSRTALVDWTVPSHAPWTRGLDPWTPLRNELKQEIL